MCQGQPYPLFDGPIRCYVLGCIADGVARYGLRGCWARGSAALSHSLIATGGVT